jgi:hypothetical protein
MLTVCFLFAWLAYQVYFDVATAAEVGREIEFLFFSGLTG